MVDVVHPKGRRYARRHPVPLVDRPSVTSRALWPASQGPPKALPSHLLSYLSNTRARCVAPPGVENVTAYGAIPHTEAPQALIGRGAPRRLRAAPAGTRHKRPSPHPRVRAAPRAQAHPGSAHRDSPPGRTGAVVPCGPLGHAPLEGRGQRILEGWHRRMGTPACGSARTDRRGGVGHASCPARHSIMRPFLWMVPRFPHALSSSPAQDLRHHPRPPS
jgi:hypothetical protein